MAHGTRFVRTLQTTAPRSPGPSGFIVRTPGDTGPPILSQQPKSESSNGPIEWRSPFHSLDGLLGTSSPETGRFFSTKRGCKEIGFKDLSVAPGYTLLVGPTMRQILTASISKSDYLDPTLSSVSALFSCAAGGDSNFLSPRHSIHRHLVARRSAVVTCAQMAVPTAPAPWAELKVLGHRPWHHTVAVWKSIWQHAGGGSRATSLPHHWNAGLRLCSNLCARRQLADFPPEKRDPSWEMRCFDLRQSGMFLRSVHVCVCLQHKISSCHPSSKSHII